jgi:hypothetical protein
MEVTRRALNFEPLQRLGSDPEAGQGGGLSPVDCRSAPLIVSEKQISQNGKGIVRNSCVSSAPNLYVIKGGHRVGSNLCGFLFGYCIGRILLPGLKDVFQSTAIFRCASVSKQFDRQRRSGQQDGH